MLRGYHAQDRAVGGRVSGAINVVLYPPDPTNAPPAARRRARRHVVPVVLDRRQRQRSHDRLGTRTVDHGQVSCPGNLDPSATCAQITDDAGATVGRTSVWRGGGVTVLEAVLLQDDGGLVYVAVSNSADDKWGAGSSVASDRAPLTEQQVLGLASDPTWTDWRAGS